MSNNTQKKVYERLNDQIRAVVSIKALLEDGRVIFAHERLSELERKLNHIKDLCLVLEAYKEIKEASND